MNSQKVLSEAWQITLKNKYLWIFGFIAGLTFSGNNISTNQMEGGAWLLQDISSLSLQGFTAILFSVISIALWILGLIARIGLIQNISAGVQSQKLIAKVMELSSSSTRFLRSIIVMQLLVWSPMIVLNFLLVFLLAPIVEPFSSSIKAGGFPDMSTFGTIWLLGVGLFLLSIPFLFIDAFSYRTIVIGNFGAIEGIKKAYYVIRTNLQFILGLSTLCVLVSIAFSFIASFAAGILLFPLSLAMGPLVQQSLSECTGRGSDFETMRRCMELVNSQPLMVGSALVMGIISAAIYSVWVTFQSSVFTLAYEKLAENS